MHTDDEIKNWLRSLEETIRLAEWSIKHGNTVYGPSPRLRPWTWPMQIQADDADHKALFARIPPESYFLPQTTVAPDTDVARLLYAGEFG